MKKRVNLLFVLILLAFVVPSQNYAQDFIKGFNLKLAGGAGTWSGGDFNAFYDDFNYQMNDYSRLFGVLIDGKMENLNWGSDFEGEFILDLTERIGIGIGIGYIHRKNESSVSIKQPPYSQSIEINPTFTAVPIHLNAYYALPVVPRIRAFFKAGVGYYFGKSEFHVKQINSYNESTYYSEENNGNGSDNTIGFQGGLGIELDISDNISFFFEGTRRYAKFNDWDIKDIYSSTTGAEPQIRGTFYYYEELDLDTHVYYRNVQFGEEEPVGIGIKNVRKAIIDYAGISLRIGIKIRLGEVKSIVKNKLTPRKADF